MQPIKWHRESLGYRVDAVTGTANDGLVLPKEIAMAPIVENILLILLSSLVVAKTLPARRLENRNGKALSNVLFVEKESSFPGTKRLDGQLFWPKSLSSKLPVKNKGELDNAPGRLDYERTNKDTLNEVFHPWINTPKQARRESVLEKVQAMTKPDNERTHQKDTVNGFMWPQQNNTSYGLARLANSRFSNGNAASNQIGNSQKDPLEEKQINRPYETKSSRVRQTQISNESFESQGAYNVNIYSDSNESADINNPREKATIEDLKETPLEKSANDEVFQNLVRKNEEILFSIEDPIPVLRFRRHLRQTVPYRANRPQIAVQPASEASRAMTHRLLELMTLAKNVSHKPVRSKSKKTEYEYGDSDYDIGTISRDLLPKDIDLDIPRDGEPTEADKELLENIEQLTFLVLGRDHDLEESQVSPIRHKAEPGEWETSGGVQSIGETNEKSKPDTWAGKRLLETQRRWHNGRTKETNSRLYGHGLMAKTGPVSFDHGARISHHRYKSNSMKYPKRHHRQHRPQSRRQRDVMPVVQAHQDESSTLTRTPDERGITQRVALIPRKVAKNIRPPMRSKMDRGQKRAVDTLDLMDDFRLAWPSLRTTASSLVGRISNLKSTYDAAYDDLERLIKMGDEYNKDAKQVAEQDKKANAKLKTETAKLKIAEKNFENFQKQIEDEEKMEMEFERKAFNPSKDSSISFGSLLGDAGAIPENKVEMTLNDITDVEPVLSVPMSEDYLQTLPLEGNRQAGLESMLLALRPDNKHSHDENLHKVAADLNEISSRADLNVKSPERRRRHTLEKRSIVEASPKADNEGMKISGVQKRAVADVQKRAGPDVQKRASAKSMRTTVTANHSKTKENPKENPKRRKRAVQKTSKCKGQKEQMEKAMAQKQRDAILERNQQKYNRGIFSSKQNSDGAQNEKIKSKEPTITNQQRSLGSDNIEFKPVRGSSKIRRNPDKLEPGRTEPGLNTRKLGPNERSEQRPVESGQFDFIDRPVIKNQPDERKEKESYSKSAPNIDSQTSRMKDEDIDMGQQTKNQY
ncbi:hypothetical protein EGW08_017847 [Elysia chlorotica]|uniref:Uncharacterized protein n=1 Tax=Elysia chlorotica TaxID=188477 RepID=A0A3S0ZAD7_ELYCH|nr:hypothetical protein EGW08_017847 [Elysia chlorotica]